MSNTPASFDEPDDSHPYRGAPRRPRIWVPGVLMLDPPDRGASEERGWRLSSSRLAGLWDGFEEVTQWKDTSHFVALVDLDLEIASAAEIVHPATLPLDLRPHVRSLVARAPLLALESGEVQRVAAAHVARQRAGQTSPPRLYAVGFARHADDFFTFSAWRDHTASRGDLDPVVTTHVSGSRWSLENSAWSSLTDEQKRALGADLDTGESDSEDYPPDDVFDDFIDRLLDAASDGMVNGASISLGLWLRQICIQYADPETRVDAERVLDEIEAEMVEITERANGQTHEAQSIRSAIEDAGGATTLNVAVYGEIRACRSPSLTVKSEPRGLAAVPLEASVHRVLHDGTTSDSIVVPERVIWYAREVEAWDPPLRAKRRERESEELRARWQATKKSGSKAAWFAAFVAITALTWALIYAVK